MGLTSAQAVQLVPFTPHGGCNENYCEDFEGTGAPTNWSSAAGNFDNTTSPLNNSQDLLLNATEDATYDPSYAASTEYFTAYLKWSDVLENGEIFFKCRNSSNAVIGQLSLFPSTPDFRCQAPGGTAQTAGDASGYTTLIKLRIRCVEGTGVNAAIYLDKWNGSSWDSQCSSTDGTTTGSIDNIQWQNTADTEDLQIDVVKDDPAAISSPDL